MYPRKEISDPKPTCTIDFSSYFTRVGEEGLFSLGKFVDGKCIIASREANMHMNVEAKERNPDS